MQNILLNKKKTRKQLGRCWCLLLCGLLAGRGWEASVSGQTHNSEGCSLEECHIWACSRLRCAVCLSAWRGGSAAPMAAWRGGALGHTGGLPHPSTSPSHRTICHLRWLSLTPTQSWTIPPSNSPFLHPLGTMRLPPGLGGSSSKSPFLFPAWQRGGEMWCLHF